MAWCGPLRGGSHILRFRKRIARVFRAGRDAEYRENMMMRNVRKDSLFWRLLSHRFRLFSGMENNAFMLFPALKFIFIPSSSHAEDWRGEVQK